MCPPLHSVETFLFCLQWCYTAAPCRVVQDDVYHFCSGVPTSRVYLRRDKLVGLYGVYMMYISPFSTGVTSCTEMWQICPTISLLLARQAARNNERLKCVGSPLLAVRGFFWIPAGHGVLFVCTILRQAACSKSNTSISIELLIVSSLNPVCVDLLRRATIP